MISFRKMDKNLLYGVSSRTLRRRAEKIAKEKEENFFKVSRTDEIQNPTRFQTIDFSASPQPDYLIETTEIESSEEFLFFTNDEEFQKSPFFDEIDDESDGEEDEEEIDFHELHEAVLQKLRDLVIRRRPSTSFIREILEVFNFAGVRVPKSRQGLFKLKHKSIQTKKIAGGEYFHYGIKSAIQNEIPPSFLENTNTITLDTSAWMEFHCSIRGPHLLGQFSVGLSIIIITHEKKNFAQLELLKVEKSRKISTNFSRTWLRTSKISN
jgi:hypothetical protein